MNRFCEYCNQRAEVGRKVCAYCGAKLPSETVSPTPASNHSQNFSSQQTYRVTNIKPKSEKPVIKLPIGCTVTIIVVLGFFILMAFFCFIGMFMDFDNNFAVYE